MRTKEQIEERLKGYQDILKESLEFDYGEITPLVRQILEKERASYELLIFQFKSCDPVSRPYD